MDQGVHGRSDAFSGVCYLEPVAMLAESYKNTGICNTLDLNSFEKAGDGLAKT
jgi:hypothetical protein